MSSRPYRVAATTTPRMPVRVDVVRKVLAGVAEVDDVEMPLHELSSEEEATQAARLAGYHALVARAGLFRAGLLERLPGLRAIAGHGAGTDHIDVAAAARLGIVVTNTPGCNARAAAELTIGLLLDVSRRISLANYLLRRSGDWEGGVHLGVQLEGRTLGLLGFGHIARAVAGLARAFGMTVMAHDPYVAGSVMQAAGVTPCERLDDLLRAAHAVSLHMPCTPATVHIINAERISTMRRGAFLINAARGALVDETALYDALQSGHLAGAGLDVLEREPPDPANPLLTLDTVVVTPHLGGSTQEALAAIARTAAEQIRICLTGGTPPFAVAPPPA